MMKLSQGERTVLKTGISKFKTLILCVLLAELVTPQIPFKGFCKLNSFKVDSGYSSILSFNYDSNEYSDLLVYNPFTNRAKLLDGKAGLEFTLRKEISLPVEISKLEPIVLQNGMTDAYAFTSRKGRSFGILKFSSYGSPTITKQLKFDYYPENISVSNRGSTSDREFLISGNSFNGLSVVSIKNNNLTEIKITDSTAFKDAYFIDLNADGNDDIAALNSVNNKIHLFFRNSNGDFEDLRQINLNDDVLSIHVFDINYDSFKDIIVSTTKSIFIFFGDSFAAYNKTVNIKTLYPADKFIYGDFNRDGFFDINYLNIEKGIISTIFAKDFLTYYPEIIYKKKQGLVDLIPYFSKFVYGAAYLNKNGEVNILSKITAISDDQQLAVTVEPNLICTFDVSKNGISDLAFTDKFDDNIKFLLRDAAGLPDKLYSIKLFNQSKNLICFSNSQFVKTFFLFSENNRLIESIEVNFEKFSFKRKHHYTKGLIQDLKIVADSKGDPQLLILYSSNNKLNLEVSTEYQSKYSSSYYEELTSNWTDPFLTISDKLNISYWQAGVNKLSLKSSDLKDNKFNPVTKLEIDINGVKIVSKSNQDYQKSEAHYVSLISSKDDLYLVKGENSVEIYESRGSRNDLRITDKNQLFFGKNNSTFVADKNSKSFFKLVLYESSKQLAAKKIFSDIEFDNYTIQKLDQRNTHLVFTNSKSGNIEIKRLPK